MTTRRTPRGMNRRISPLAVEIFKQMQALECTCEPRDWAGKYWKHEPCSACEQWWTLHSVLHNVLNCKPWEWPCIRDPEAVCPYPQDHTNAKQWHAERKANPKSLELFMELSRLAAQK